MLLGAFRSGLVRYIRWKHIAKAFPVTEITMVILALAFLIGMVGGLRALTAPTMTTWGARLGTLQLDGTWLAFLGYRWTPLIFTLAAIGELINDKLPNTPSRKVPVQFTTRIFMGALAGSAITTAHGGSLEGILIGGLGAVAGTLGGASLRARLVRAIGGKDWPIAILEDMTAVLGGIFIVGQAS